MAATSAVGNVTYGGLKYFCDLCPSGMACESTGLSVANTVCAAGYWCNIGAISRYAACTSTFCVSMYGVCPVGFHCPLGSVAPVVCGDGTYMTGTQASVCDICPAGFYCSNTAALNCPLGHFCPKGTGATIPPCPIGRYGNTTNLQTEDDCRICDAGHFCSATGLSRPNGVCSPGFFCPEGSFNNLGETVYITNSTCPYGSYCPSGSVTPLACPPGTFNPVRAITSILQCEDCTPGHYCSAFNLSSVSGLCGAGYFCELGAMTVNPVSFVRSNYTCKCKLDISMHTLTLTLTHTHTLSHSHTNTLSHTLSLSLSLTLSL